MKIVAEVTQGGRPPMTDVPYGAPSSVSYFLFAIVAIYWGLFFI
jgi:hypothetical protein